MWETYLTGGVVGFVAGAVITSLVILSILNRNGYFDNDPLDPPLGIG